MSIASNPLNSRIRIALALYCLTVALLLVGTLYVSLGSLNQKQLDALGSALGAQLSESLKEPLINRDSISQQVLLDNLLADTPGVVRATLYSNSNRILSQSQRDLVTPPALAVYSAPVRVDNKLLGQVRVELNETRYLEEYRRPMWLVLSVWLVGTAMFAFWLLRLAGNYSARIRTLNESFPQSEVAAGSELDQLEVTLQPFTQSAVTDIVEMDYCYCLLAISIPNLAKWRVQLNATAFSQMLAKIDSVIDTHLSLYDGERQGSRDTALIVRFDNESTDHPAVRAINCANALIKLCDQVAVSQHLPFEIRIAAAYRCPPHSGSPWRNDIEQEDCIARLIELLPIAGSWELVIDKHDLDTEELQGFRMEEFSAANLWQFRSYDDERQALFDKQLAFLSSNLNL